MPSRSSWRFVLALLLLVVLTVWSFSSFADRNRLQVYFFDVGQGDSILVKSGSFELLVDGGPDQTVLSHLGRALPPWDRTIEVVVLTHPHADHVTGLVEILKRYEVQEVWGTGAIHLSDIYLQFLQAIKDARIPYRIMKSGDRHSFPDFDVEVLYPERDFSGVRMENVNESSIVLKVIHGNFSAMLTGDSEEKNQEELVASDRDLSSTVLKVPHQGSRDADLPSFLKSVSPTIAVLSVGEKNRFGHPHREVIERYESMGIPILRTDLHGTVHLTIRGSQLWIRTGKGGILSRVELAK